MGKFSVLLKLCTPRTLTSSCAVAGAGPGSRALLAGDGSPHIDLPEKDEAVVDVGEDPSNLEYEDYTEVVSLRWTVVLQLGRLLCHS